MCQDSKAAAKLKLVHTFASGPYAAHILIDTFSIAFSLHEEKILDRPLIARCDLAVDAADMSIIFSLMSGKQTPGDYPDGVEGMLQIKSFIPLDSAVAIDAGRRKIWEQARAKNQELQNNPVDDYPTGLIDFHLEGTGQVVTIPFDIPNSAIQGSRYMARLGGLCLQIVNTYLPIRSRKDFGTLDTMQSSIR